MAFIGLLSDGNYTKYVWSIVI